jgi:hypothetical protein
MESESREQQVNRSDDRRVRVAINVELGHQKLRSGLLKTPSRAMRSLYATRAFSTHLMRILLRIQDAA